MKNEILTTAFLKLINAVTKLTFSDCTERNDEVDCIDVTVSNNVRIMVYIPDMEQYNSFIVRAEVNELGEEIETIETGDIREIAKFVEDYI